MNFNSECISYEKLSKLSSKKDIEIETSSILQNMHNYINQINSAESEEEKQKIEEEKQQYLEAFKSDKDSETILEIAKCFAFANMYVSLGSNNIQEEKINRARTQYDILSAILGQNTDNQEFEEIKQNASEVIDTAVGLSPIFRYFLKIDRDVEKIAAANEQFYDSLAKEMKTDENSERVIDCIYAFGVYNACKMLEDTMSKEQADSAALGYQTTRSVERSVVNDMIKTAIEAKSFEENFLQIDSQVEDESATL